MGLNFNDKVKFTYISLTKLKKIHFLVMTAFFVRQRKERKRSNITSFSV